MMAALQSTLWAEGALPGGVGHTTRCRGRVFWDCTRFIIGVLEEKPKTGKEKGQGSLGRKKCGKIELELVVSKQADISRLMWPCTAPDQHSLSCILSNPISIYVPVSRDCLLCACVFGGLHASSWSRAMVKWTT